MSKKHSFLFLRERGCVNNHGLWIDTFYKVTANSPFSQNLQSICLFLEMYYYVSNGFSVGSTWYISYPVYHYIFHIKFFWFHFCYNVFPDNPSPEGDLAALLISTSITTILLSYTTTKRVISSKVQHRPLKPLRE